MPYTPLDQTRVLWDSSGKPYWASLDGKSRHYIPPIAAAQYRDDPRMLAWAKSQGFELQRNAQGDITGMVQAPGAGAGGNRPLDFRTGRTWDTERGEYRTGFDWGDVLTLGVGGLVGAGAASAIGGAGAGSAGSAIPAASIPGAHAAVPAAIASQGASAAIPLASAGAGAGAAGAASAAGGAAPLPSASIPGAHTAVPAAIGSQGVSQAVGTSMPDGGGVGRMLRDLASPENAAGLAALIAGLSGNRNSGQNSDEARRIQAITEARMRRVDPLHQVSTQLAFGRLPVNYRAGIAPPSNAPLPE